MRKIQIVADINEFHDHIACDTVFQSEIIIPIINNDKLIGVLDIDSPIRKRFNNVGAEGLNDFVNILNNYICWSDK